jgi:hypothetical protein
LNSELHTGAAIALTLAQNKMDEKHERIFRELREKKLREAGIDPACENSLLNAIPATKDFYLLKDIVGTLYVIGTKTSLPALEELLHYPKEDVKISAFSTIVRIMGADGQDTYLEKLTDPKFRDKFGAILAIRQYCDDRAIEAVTNRLKTIIARERKAVYYYSPGSITELLAAFDYLYSQEGEPRATARRLILENQNRLESKEKKWIEVNVPGLLEAGDEAQSPSVETTNGQQDAGGKGGKHSWFASLWKR